MPLTLPLAPLIAASSDCWAMDGALGFWHALREIFGATKEQRCWFHKHGNVLNAMPKSVQAKAKGYLHDIWQAETRVNAEAAFGFFVTTYGVKYDKAVGKLTKDRDVLLAFYDFPAEHWKHVRTTNPIESTFAIVRHRTGKTKGCLSRKTGLAMAFKLMILLGTLLCNTLSGNGQRRRNGENLTEPTVCPRSSRGLNSRTGSSNFKTPPNQAVTNFWA